MFVFGTEGLKIDWIRVIMLQNVLQGEILNLKRRKIEEHIDIVLSVS